MLNLKENALPYDKSTGHCTLARAGGARADVHEPGEVRGSEVERELALARYIEGWAEADAAKIAAAVAPGYRFFDPFVGGFSAQTLAAYLEIVRIRFAATGPTERADLAFVLRGPMAGPDPAGRLQFRREAPYLGLTGIAQIETGEGGVTAETVAYDLNLASDVLCRAPRLPAVAERRARKCCDFAFRP